MIYYLELYYLVIVELSMILSYHPPNVNNNFKSTLTIDKTIIIRDSEGNAAVSIDGKPEISYTRFSLIDFLKNVLKLNQTQITEVKEKIINESPALFTYHWDKWELTLSVGLYGLGDVYSLIGTFDDRKKLSDIKIKIEVYPNLSKEARKKVDEGFDNAIDRLSLFQQWERATKRDINDILTRGGYKEK